MSYSNDWSNAVIIDHTKFNQVAAGARRTRLDISERLTNLFYGWASGETQTDEGVKNLPFVVQSGNPGATANKVKVYAKDVDAKAELFAQDEDGNVIKVTSKGSLAIPAGIILPNASDTPPTGYLLCDGSAVSRATYSALFTAIGTVWGVGDGSTTFNIPDLRDVVLVGKGTTFGTLAASGGAATHDHGAATGSHTLTTDEIPSHQHGIHNSNGGGGGGGDTTNLQKTDNTNLGGINTDAAGGGQGHTHPISAANNYQPSKTVNFVIKT